MNTGKSMLQDWAAVAEIISAIAVVVSLVYVGLGLRENTKAIEGTTFQQMVRASNEYLLAVAADSGLAIIMLHAWSDSTQLTPVEWLRYFYHERVFWRNMENAYFQHKRGVLDDEGWEVYRRVACSGTWNKKNWQYHSTEFVGFIDARSDSTSNVR